MKYVVRLTGLEKPPERRYITRGNAYPQAIATYDTQEEAQAMADKCHPAYRPVVVGRAE